jgi:hypothetical protein
MDDYVNPTAEGALSWQSISYCTSDSKEALEYWKQKLHEVSTRRCAHITRTLCQIGYEVCGPSKYDRITYMNYLVKEFELQILKQQRFLALDVMLKAARARWWAAHKNRIDNSQQCKRLLQVRFGTKTEYTA